jgi:hypothetical protein
MDMDSGDMDMGDLSDVGMNMSNTTVAYDFLQDILDYTDFQPMDQSVALAFWYGVAIVIGIVAACNMIQWLTLKARFAPFATVNWA